MVQGTKYLPLLWVKKIHPTRRQLFLRCRWWAACFQPPLKQLVGLLSKSRNHLPGKQLKSLWIISLEAASPHVWGFCWVSDTTFSVWLLQLSLTAGLPHSCKLLLRCLPLSCEFVKSLSWPPHWGNDLQLQWISWQVQLPPERLSPAQPVSSDITKLGFPASSPPHFLMHWLIPYFDMNLNL